MQFDDFFFEGVGSSINYRYAVNTSLVKPLTLAAGGASYALIKHPEGLKCDSRQWSLGPQRLVFCVWSSCLKLTQKLFEDKTYRHTEISSSNPSILPNLRFGVLGCFRYIFLGVQSYFEKPKVFEIHQTLTRPDDVRCSTYVFVHLINTIFH